MYITGLSFVICVALPFIFLPPIWAIVSLLFGSLVGPLLNQVILIPLVSLIRSVVRPSQGVSINEQFPNFGFVDGIIECLILIIFYRIVPAIPTNFLYITAAIYLINQLGRVYKHGYNDKNHLELKQLIGFTVTLVVNTIL